MSRVPPQLQRFWPLIKRGHRYGARVTGAVGRHAGGPARGLPRTAAPTARETVRREPVGTRFHALAPAYTLDRPMPVGEPADHPYFAARARQEVPERFVLDLRDGLLLGRHLATVTAGGILDSETSHYWGISGWREHPVFWNPWPGPVRHVEGTVGALAARGTGGNYYHFLIDALPRWEAVRRVLGGADPDYWVLDHATRYEKAYVELMGIDPARIITPGPGFALRADRLLVPSLPNVETLVEPGTTTWLRERFPAGDLSGLPERIYVTRGDVPNTRRVVGEDRLFAALAERGFARIDPGALDVQQQIDHFAAARVVVAPHGAALTNLSFARPGVRLLELFAPGYVNGGYWSIAGNIPDSRYRYLVGDGDPGRTTPGAEPVMQDIEVDPDRVLRALDALEM